ncbi:hypothetical protein AOL_s00169g55 [Orbilia oligospora ATCC 24927]|uniref:Uncharacterized protein n=2 Tax=Orbilia oligospora TaxID=2813651 RepID=G1XMK2_ARTOA|nr:hypothetical protein AOL_s00169g55 [Orbilia oligospora ATCC 24927]EGX45449.1 hypothetical protein AOL_s00169g55 [Orbilia oligospora ATCC 24927]KAF3283163.1 hypothetical protein TWF970_001142 [Orbilia oligospora]
MDNPNDPENLACELENLRLERIFRQRGFPPGLISPSFSTTRPAARHQILSTEEYDYSPPQFIPNQTSSPARTPGYTPVPLLNPNTISSLSNPPYYCSQHIPSNRIGDLVEEIPRPRPDWQQYDPDPSSSCISCQTGRQRQQHQLQQRSNYQQYLQQHLQLHHQQQQQQQQQSSAFYNPSFHFRAVNPNPEEQEKRMRRSADEIRRNMDDCNRQESNIRESNMKVQSWLDRWGLSFGDEGGDDENLEEVELV